MQEKKEDVMRWLDRAMERGYEGVMFKGLETPYVPGSRDWDWAKLKPDHVRRLRPTPWAAGRGESSRLPRSPRLPRLQWRRDSG